MSRRRKRLFGVAASFVLTIGLGAVAAQPAEALTNDSRSSC